MPEVSVGVRRGMACPGSPPPSGAVAGGHRAPDAFLPVFPSVASVVRQTQTFQRKLVPVPEGEALQCHLPDPGGTFSGQSFGVQVRGRRQEKSGVASGCADTRGSCRGAQVGRGDPRSPRC